MDAGVGSTEAVCGNLKKSDSSAASLIVPVSACPLPVSAFALSLFPPRVASPAVHLGPAHVPVDMSDEFQLWPQLAAGKTELLAFPLSLVLLMEDKNFPWIVLVRGQAMPGFRHRGGSVGIRVRGGPLFPHGFLACSGASPERND